MTPTLNDVEVRVLGSLIEKQVTTPDYYPLTLNALTNACNQLSNREPVVSYDEKTVASALETLREKNLAYVFYGSDSRVPKYKHVARENLELDDPQLAAMCVLMLRGPQTVGEIKGRTGRLYPFSDLNEVETTLNKLSERESPLVAKLPRQAGRKESRFAQLLSGPVEVDESPRELRPEPATVEARAENARLAELETQVGLLRTEVENLRAQFDEFRRQFE
jgi:uncharacterized protein YceH (UPF0502 family)